VGTELKIRGVPGNFIDCMVSSKGFPEAIEKVNMSLQKVTKSRSSFKPYEVLLKLS